MAKGKYFADRTEANALVKKVYAEIGDPFTLHRFEEHLGNRAGMSIRARWGWGETLRFLGITVSRRRGPFSFNFTIPMTKGGAATASVDGPPHCPSSSSTENKANRHGREMPLVDYDRSTISGFTKYMLENPIYYTDLTGRACNEQNVEATCKLYEAVGLISRVGLRLTSEQNLELAKYKRGKKEHAEKTSSGHAKRGHSHKTGGAHPGYHLQGDAGRGEIIIADHCRGTYQGGIGGRNLLDMPTHDLAGSGGA